MYIYQQIFQIISVADEGPDELFINFCKKFDLSRHTNFHYIFDSLAGIAIDLSGNIPPYMLTFPKRGLIDSVDWQGILSKAFVSNRKSLEMSANFTIMNIYTSHYNF